MLPSHRYYASENASAGRWQELKGPEPLHEIKVHAIFSKQAPDTERTYNPWFYLGVVTYITAFTIWLNQWSDLLCYPDSWFQPHAAWHLLSALSTWFFFVFFRTEKIIKA